MKELAVAVAPVETKSLVTVREFESHMRPGGRPLRIQGWTADWQALTRWSFRYFGERYGADPITVRDDSSGTTIETTIAEYVSYLNDPAAESRLADLAAKLNRDRPFYCLSYKPFAAHPELWDDVSVPPFVADWWPHLSGSFTAKHFPKDQGWVFLAAARSTARMHRDSHHTLTWLAQVAGRKEYFLFPPDEAERVYHGAVDPSAPDLSKFPLYEQAAGLHCVLNPGEMLFLPADWWHFARALDDSITISCNFVNHINFGDYLVAAFGPRLPEILAAVPGSPPSAVTR
jgi:histone arginine demethylase JMJD6